MFLFYDPSHTRPVFSLVEFFLGWAVCKAGFTINADITILSSPRGSSVFYFEACDGQAGNGIGHGLSVQLGESLLQLPPSTVIISHRVPTGWSPCSGGRCLLNSSERLHPAPCKVHEGDVLCHLRLPRIRKRLFIKESVFPHF